MGMLIGLSVHCVVKARKRYTYAMGLLIGVSVQFVLKTENGIPLLDDGIIRGVKRTICSSG